jgi:RHS repeat-associated protein
MVKKSNGTLYWRDVGGQTLAESDLSGVISEEYIAFAGKIMARVDRPSNSVHYYLNDILGSSRMVVSSFDIPTNTFSVEQDIDYYPYGGERIIANTVPQHYKFTGKERDAESGLDNFGARYVSSSLGRFVTPDPASMRPNQLVNPQRWNMYGYGVNNPLRYVDPDGLDAIMVVYPKYQAEASGKRYPTGHGAMIVVDKNGKTTYREYGRYPPSGDLGRTRGVSVPSLKMDKDGHPTDASMQKLLQVLSQTNQKGPVEALYFDEDDAMDAALLKELQRRMDENGDPNRDEYSLRNHNCGTLFCETMNAAGNHMPSAPWFSSPKSLFDFYSLYYPWWNYAYFYFNNRGFMKTNKLREVVTHKITDAAH